MGPRGAEPARGGAEAQGEEGEEAGRREGDDLLPRLRNFKEESRIDG